MSEKEKEVLDGDKKEDWMNAKWRPMMGWMYMLVCTCDFVIFPVLWSIMHALLHTGSTTQWSPLTLQGAGLFHMAMGAIIGVAAFGRTQEKLAGANNGGLGSPSGFGGAPSTGGFGSSNGFTSPATTTTGFGNSSGFGGVPTSTAPKSFGSTSSFGGAKPTTATSSCGRAMPAQEDDPVL